MKVFRCDRCDQPVFFENVVCLNCGSDLAFLPDRMGLYAMERLAEVDTTTTATADAPFDGPLWVPHGAPSGHRYRLCRNHAERQACNFAVPEHDANPWCVSCRQTRLLPDLSVPGNAERWYRIEVAKRRLYYTLAQLGLVDPRETDAADGPTYEFLADLPGQPVLTGHRGGVITLNVAEADDDERARRRVALHEPFRTLLGHLRHESGHYYWDRLIRDAGRTDDFRATFGDESVDYAQSLQAHYAAAQTGTDADWQDSHVSAYATAHPWEDWAETWAHYLHMVDLLDTAAAYRARVAVPGSEGAGARISDPFGNAADFDELVRQWVPVTLMLNSLNRSLGQNDAYPFAMSEGALTKLRFVHDTIKASAIETGTSAGRSGGMGDGTPAALDPGHP